MPRTYPSQARKRFATEGARMDGVGDLQDRWHAAQCRYHRARSWRAVFWLRYANQRGIRAFLRRSRQQDDPLSRGLRKDLGRRTSPGQAQLTGALAARGMAPMGWRGLNWRSGTASPGRSEGWGGWGAIS